MDRQRIAHQITEIQRLARMADAAFVLDDFANVAYYADAIEVRVARLKATLKKDA